MEMTTAPALVATLGLAPQIITRALDEMLKPNVEPGLGPVYIIHTSAFRKHDHWPSFAHFTVYLEQTYSRLSFHLVPIKDENGRTVYDVETPETAELAFKTVFNIVKQLKREGRRLHGLIAGGRKSMIVYTMISAQLLFDEDDQLWHLYSSQDSWEPHESLKSGNDLTESKDRSHLVEIPILHLAGLMPMVRELILNSDDPTQAIRLYRKHETVEQIVRLQRFYLEECDEIDRKILLLAAKGWGNRKIGDAVGLTETPVTNRITKMARKFYRSKYTTRRLHPWPRHVKIVLLRDLAPFLNQLLSDE